MSKNSLHQTSFKARRSVWLLAFLGSAIGAALFLVIALVLFDMRRQRERRDLTHSKSDAALSEAISEAVAVRDRIVATLVSGDHSLDQNDSPRRLLAIGQRLAEAGLADDTQSIDAIAGEMSEAVALAQQWREKHEQAVARQFATHRDVRSALDDLQDKVARIEGEHRLQLAIELRRSRRSSDQLSFDAMKQLFVQLSHQSELSAIKIDLAKLETVVERLDGETQTDNLPDIRDNLLKPLIDRLTLACQELGATDECNAVLIGILGEGYEIDHGHQTIQPGEGGLLLLSIELLEQNTEYLDLLAQATKSYDEWRLQLTALERHAESIRALDAEEAEQALMWVWGGAALLGLIANLSFFYLAHRISQTLDAQIGALDQVSRELAQAQKLESIGQLAAGVAHEINTPMQYVYDNIDYLSSCIDKVLTVFEAYDKLLDRDSQPLSWGDRVDFAREVKQQQRFDYIWQEVPQAIEDSRTGLNQVLQIVRAMKTFSHPGAEEFASTDINQSIISTAAITRNRWKYHAELTTELDESLPCIMALPAEINQVLLNLVVNAADAIAERYGESGEKGLITVTTRCEDDHVVLEVADNGAGIPNHIRTKIFEPFFTTKEVGKGTGQGLAICYNVVVAKHSGSMSVDSTPGVGTTFRVSLPIEQVLDDEVDNSEELEEEVANTY